jgi:2-methylcitrate dehydratase PrpD
MNLTANDRNGSFAVGFADLLAARSLEQLDQAQRVKLDTVIRSCLIALGIGVTLERAVATVRPEDACRPVTPSTDMYSAMTVAFFEGMLAAATDLDPLDVGPAHCALPAVVAACVASAMTGRSHDAIAEGVLSGIEWGSHLRSAVQGLRPGAAFHSAGVFGTIAAAGAASRALDSTPRQTANAIGIALTRSAGLAANSAATQVGLTHFGWAAAHGLEAALLARDGMTASLDLAQALGAFFPQASVQLDSARPLPVGESLERTYFKQYPCNIYLNLVVLASAGLQGQVIDRIALEIPPVRHLDQPVPVDLRAARNSAQAVAAAAALAQPRYAMFCAPEFDLHANAELRRLAGRVSVAMDDNAPTALASASARVVAWSGKELISDRTIGGTELTTWPAAARERLTAGLGLDAWFEQLTTAPYYDAHAAVVNRMLAPMEGS